jgi:hypothetical protein
MGIRLTLGEVVEPEELGNPLSVKAVGMSLMVAEESRSFDFDL